MEDYASAHSNGPETPIPSYRVNELIKRFDQRTPGQTRLTGQLSSLLGESILLEVLAHAIEARGEHVTQPTAAVPHLDKNALPRRVKKTPRDLDAWLTVDGRLSAVEIKTWTASSIDGVNIDDADPSVLEKVTERNWNTAVADFASDKWTNSNKVALPLKVPDELGLPDGQVERYLVFWRPVSSNGLNPWSTAQRQSYNARRKSIMLTVNVFSASLYLRSIQHETDIIPCRLTDPTHVLEAIDSVIERQ